MTKIQLPALHASQHLPNGSDPIPGLMLGPPSFPEYIGTLAATLPLLGYWRLGEGASPYADTSGHAAGPANAVDVGSGAAITVLTTGALTTDDDGAVQFNGGHYLDAPDPVPRRFNLTNQNCTFAAWVNPQADASTFIGGIVSQWYDAGSGDCGWILGINWPARTPFFSRRPSSGAAATVTGPPLTAGSWAFIVATYNTATGSSLYINGALSATNATTFSTGVAFNNGPNFGLASGITVSKAGLDEVSIWGDVMTLDQIANLYEAGGGTTTTTAPDATTTSKGVVQLAGDLTGTAASPQIAAGVITDAEVAAANKDGIATLASLRTLGTGAQQAAAGNDTRFTDARAPTAHATTHQPGGSDAMTVDAVAATGSLRTLGTGAQQAAAGNDSRLTNARTPTAHATTHQPGGTDAMTVDAAAAIGSLRTLGIGAAQAAPGNDSRFLPTDTVVVAGTRILANKLVGTDTYPAFRLFGDGKLEWGLGGGSAPDTNLYHSGPGDLRTSGRILIDGNAAIKNGTAQQLYMGDVIGGTQAGIVFGLAGDTSLYRLSQDNLASDDNLIARQTGATRIALGDVIGGGQAGLVFGTNADTNLYRDTQNSLFTSGLFKVNGSGAGVSSPTAAGLLLNWPTIGTRWLEMGPADSAGAGYRSVRITN